MTNYCIGANEAATPTIIIAFMVLFICILLARFCLKYNSKSTIHGIKTAEAAKTIRIAGGAGLLCYFVGMLLFLMHGMSNIVQSCSDSYNYHIIPSLAYPINYSGFSVLLVLFSLRLIKTFEETKYAISHNMAIFLQVATILPFVVLFLIGILRGTDTIGENVAIRGGFGLIILMMLLSFILLRLFVVKLGLVINDFIEQFGKVSQIDLATLNKSLRSVCMY